MATNENSLTGGSQGTIALGKVGVAAQYNGQWERFQARVQDWLGLSSKDVTMLVIVWIAAIVLLALVWLAVRTPWGRVLRAIREDEEATLALGKDVFSFRLQAFVIGCAIMGLAGAVYASFLRLIVPSQFDPLATFTIYVMVVLGGGGNNRGVMFGAFLFYTFDWVSVRLKDYLPENIQEKVPPLRLMAIGILLVLLILYRPEGIFKEPKRTYPPVT